MRQNIEAKSVCQIYTSGLSGKIARQAACIGSTSDLQIRCTIYTSSNFFVTTSFPFISDFLPKSNPAPSASISTVSPFT